MLIRALIEASLGKPQLVRETTRKAFPWSLISFASRSASRLCPSVRGESVSDVESSFDDLVLPAELKERVIEMAQSTRNARRYNAPFRHVLLYGSPGTGENSHIQTNELTLLIFTLGLFISGKTMVAKKLAKVVGLDYACMSGGDVSPLGSDAVSQIHSLFSWARMSPVGVLLFIDEAECFLGSRDSGFTSEAAHNALNALLYNTGGERRDFMMVLATNRAQDLDAAVLDRCDEALHFPLPDESCRERLLRLYYNQNLKGFVRKNNEQVLSLRSRLTRLITKDSPLIMSIDSEIMKGEHLESIVAVTYGFSGREIGKLMIALQGAMYVSKDGRLDFVSAWKVIRTKVREHHDKRDMVGDGETNESEPCDVSRDR